MTKVNPMIDSEMSPAARLGQVASPAAAELYPRWRDFGAGKLAVVERRMEAAPETAWLLEAFQALRRVQLVDQGLLNLSKRSKIGVYTPLKGQEAAQVGAALALAPSDWMVPTFRDMGVQLLRNEPLHRLMLFHMGYEEGARLTLRNLPIAAPVASQLPHATGLGWAMQRLAERSAAPAVLALLGDGATSKGDFHEAMNLAGVLQLPVVFFCQNNQWALSTPATRQTAAPTLAQKAIGYGFRGVQVDGTDVISVHHVAGEALEAARRGDGPTLIEAVTERQGPHSASDNPKLYGHTVNHQPAPGEALHRWLVEQGLWSSQHDAALEASVRTELEEGLARAEQMASQLDQDRHSAFVHVHAEMSARLAAQSQQAQAAVQSEPPVASAPPPAAFADAAPGRKMRLVEALNLALAEELARDPTVLVYGEDVGRLGGVFRVTAGLMRRFGEQRVLDLPLSESGMVGTGIGLGLAGHRPVCEIQFAGFIYSAYEQLRSHAARFRTRTRGSGHVPMVVRAPYGARVGTPESHSDSVEMLFANTPGIKVVVASTPRKARALLKAAIRDPDPVVFLEPIAQYRTVREHVPEAEELAPLGQAFIVRAGRDVTLVTYGAMLADVVAAAHQLAARGVSAEVIDLASLSPLDDATVAASVAKTERLVVVHEGSRTADVGAELLARLHPSFGAGGFRFQRVCGWDIPPAFHARDKQFLPSPRAIVDAVETLMR